MDFLNELGTLLFPTRCIACSALGPSLCTLCRKVWNPHKYIRRIHSEDEAPIKIYSSIEYSSVAKKVLLASKESAVKAADQLMIEALSHSLNFVEHRSDVEALIPIPSRMKITRSRGRFYMGELTRVLSELSGIPAHNVLHHGRYIRDQSELHLDQRWNNLKEAFVVDPEARSQMRVLLVDDLVTTGASLTEGARALESAGIKVLGAVTACTAEPVRLAHLT